MVRRITAGLFVLVFLFNATGYYIVFKVRQHQVRHEIKLKLIRSVAEEELTVLRFDPSSEEYQNLDWKEPHEFRYKGRMFDISWQETDENGFILFHCINDSQEEELFAGLDEHVKNHLAASGRANKGEDNEMQKVKKDYFIDSFPLLLVSEKIRITFLVELAIPGLIVADVAVPPPDKA